MMDRVVFLSGVSYATNANAVSLLVGDFNQDGIPDLVTANEASNSIDVRLGNGDGTFGSASTTALGSPVDQLASGDINGDGILDLVALAQTGFVEVLTGNGRGGFTVSTHDAELGIAHVALGDLDGNGTLDLALLNTTSGNIEVYQGNGDGTFGESFYSVATGIIGGSSLRIADLNNDGRLDLAATEQGAGNGVHVFLNQGNNAFGAGTIYDAGGLNTFNGTLGDMDGDGYLDIVIGTNAGQVVRLNQGNGTFGSATTYNATSNNRYGLTTGDINNDGVLDLIGMSATTGHVSLGTVTSGTAPILPFSLQSIYESRQALSMLKNKSALLSKQRGEIGAYQARLGVANNVLSSTRENYKSAAARIQDADIAEESAKLVRNQILQQAASAVLAQANQQPQLVLQLL